ncbi:YqhV family protein [Alkalihalobacillus sp. MEB130]|uniref:YqhV family protein n=1 Tax=Alkalihalobacillus sp. MEB130 TaxID=2976704 RepID=UPI0028E078E7|nr:YqhV family protein [Alkalihalobacillus sp. MEB130]MDT8862516.1 YqhV family protein [Alkalihalobacillus sp. MEB130]
MKTWFYTIEMTLLVMVGLRVISGLIELTVAGLILKFNSIEKAVALNAMLAIIGPTIFIASIALGLIGMSDKLSLSKFLFIGAGVALILIGIRK